MFTDILIVLLGILLIVRGAARGIWFSILAPIALVVSGITAYLYFFASKNLMIAIAIAIITPLLITSLVKNFFDDIKPPSPISRILGAIVTVLWGLPISITMIYLCSFFPSLSPEITSIKKDIKSSIIVSFASKPIEQYYFTKKSPAIQTTTSSEKNSATPAEPTLSPVEKLAKDPRMIELRDDPQIQKDIAEKNFPALMKNPKILELMKDPEFIKNALLSAEQMKQNESTSR